MAASARKNPLTVLLLVIVVILGCEVAWLIVQNRRLQSLLDDVPSLQLLQQGQTVPPLSGTDLDGAAVSIRYGAGQPSTLLVWFSPACHVCAENTEFWNEIYARYRSSAGIRFLIMSDGGVDETRTYVKEHGIEFPVLCVADAALLNAYNGRVMPQTALISPQGGIEKVWPGALEDERRNEITTRLNSLTM